MLPAANNFTYVPAMGNVGAVQNRNCNNKKPNETTPICAED